MRLHIFATVASIWIGGCASTAPTYDVNATESLGRIVSKNVSGARKQVAADSRNSAASMVPLIGIIAADALDAAFQKKTEIQIYEYRIRLPHDREVVVLSDFSGNWVGDCVKVFESQMPTYPRFVSHDGCEK